MDTLFLHIHPDTLDLVAARLPLCVTYKPGVTTDAEKVPAWLMGVGVGGAWGEGERLSLIHI